MTVPAEPDLVEPPRRFVDPRTEIREDDVTDLPEPDPPSYSPCAACGDPQTWPGPRCITCRIGVR